MSSRLLAPLLAMLAATACARNTQPARVGIEHVTPAHEPSSQSSVATTHQNSPKQTPQPMLQAATRADASGHPALLNEQIVAILDAFYAGRIALAQQALWRANDPGVRHLAQRLLQEHVHARDHLARLGVMRSHSDLSFNLLRKAGNDLMRLRFLEDADYDKAWTSLSIVDSQNFTHLLTSTLIPSATQPMLDAQMRHLVPQYVADTEDEVRLHANLVIPMDEQRALEREAATAPASPAVRARAQGGSPRSTPPPPAPAPEAPPPNDPGRRSPHDVTPP